MQKTRMRTFACVLDGEITLVLDTKGWCAAAGRRQSGAARHQPRLSNRSIRPCMVAPWHDVA
jgi:hypothetical protein